MRANIEARFLGIGIYSGSGRVAFQVVLWPIGLRFESHSHRIGRGAPILQAEGRWWGAVEIVAASRVVK